VEWKNVGHHILSEGHLT